MKLFGQFLIELNLITKEDFVKAMIKQSNDLPSMPSALHDLKLLTTEKLLNAFHFQSTHMCDFKDACIGLGYWNDEEFHHPLVRHYLSHVRPLGEILVENKALTVAQLSDALSKYVELGDYSTLSLEKGGEVRAPSARPLAVNRFADSEESVKESLIQSEPIVRREVVLKTGAENPFEFSPAEKTICYLYCRHFNDARLAKIKSLVNVSTADERMVAKRELTAIRTAAIMIRAERCRDLIDALLKALDHTKQDLANDIAVDKALGLLWQLREGFSAGITEAGALLDSDLSQHVSNTISTLTKMG